MKGQYTIVALIATVMMLLAFIALYPVIKSAIDSAVPSMDPYTATILQLVPFFIIVAIVLTIVFLVLPVSTSE